MEDTMKMITLVSKEDEEYIYPIIYVTDFKWKGEPLSFLLHITIEDYVDSGEINKIGKIPLMDCDSTSLRVFIEFSKIFEEEDLVEFTAPLISNKLSDMGIHQRYVDFLEEVYDNIGIKQLMKIIEDMAYLQCSSLKHLIAAFIASKIKHMDEDQKKVFFGIKSEEACAGVGC